MNELEKIIKQFRLDDRSDRKLLIENLFNAIDTTGKINHNNIHSCPDYIVQLYSDVLLHSQLYYDKLDYLVLTRIPNDHGKRIKLRGTLIKKASPSLAVKNGGLSAVYRYNKSIYIVDTDDYVYFLSDSRPRKTKDAITD